VRNLRAAGIEIGAHTVHHPILRLLNDAEAEREIAESRRQLEVIVGDSISLFAYPNGQPERDYEDRHVSMVRKLGFTAAVSTAPGVSRPGDDVHQLKRFSPWDQADGRWLARLVQRHVIG
jgi:peptidoglycan/xylan/chitin deacetylase (PgdA/CDA1 family)